MNQKITVIEALCGQGKSSYMIQTINSEPPDRRWMYIVPYREEIKRVIRECPDRNLKTPKAGRGFKSLSEHLHQLIADGESVVITHELFKKINKKTMNELEGKSFRLVMDEPVECVKSFSWSPEVMDDLIRGNFLSLEQITHERLKDGKDIRRVTVGSAEPLDSLYVKDEDGKDVKIGVIRRYAEMDRLMWVNGSILLWIFPVKLLRVFDEIYTLTYLFDGSYLKYFYDIHGLKYELKTVRDTGNRNYELIDYDREQEVALRKQVYDKIRIYEGEYNRIEYSKGRHIDKDEVLSKGWYECKSKRNRSVNHTKRIKRWKLVGMKARNFLSTYCKLKGSKGHLVMYTSFQSNNKDKDGNLIPMARPQDYVSRYVPCNIRATNDYRSVLYVAYLINVYPDPTIENYFKAFNFPVDQRMYAVSSLIQFIFRSAIREGKEIQLFLPSYRMRRCLNDWGNDALVADTSVEYLK